MYYLKKNREGKRMPRWHPLDYTKYGIDSISLRDG